jgi:hypothetical protein
VIQKATYLSDLHFDHNQWNSELSFWEGEIKTFSERLTEVVKNWNSKDDLAKAEHFQNVFILHQEKIDILKHDIHSHEETLAQIAKSQPDEVNKKHFVDHTELRERVDMQRKIFREMKTEFFTFLTAFMKKSAN